MTNADASSWKHRRFQDGVPLPCSLSLSRNEFDRVRAGLVPQSMMDDKWFIYYEAPFLYFHRSLTGEPVYRLKFGVGPARASVEEALLASEVAKISEESEEYDARLVDALISNLLLDQDKHFPLPWEMRKPWWRRWPVVVRRWLRSPRESFMVPVAKVLRHLRDSFVVPRWWRSTRSRKNTSSVKSEPVATSLLLGTKHESLRALVAEVLRHLPEAELMIADWRHGDPYSIGLGVRSAPERRAHISRAPHAEGLYLLSCEFTATLDSNPDHSIEADYFSDLPKLAIIIAEHLGAA